MSKKVAKAVVATFAIPICVSFMTIFAFFIGILAGGASIILLVQALYLYGLMTFMWCAAPFAIIIATAPFMAELGDDAIDYALVCAVSEMVLGLIILALLAHYAGW